MNKCIHCNKYIWFWQKSYYSSFAKLISGIGLVHDKCLTPAIRKYDDRNYPVSWKRAAKVMNDAFNKEFKKGRKIT